jgi:hypothetical protein
VLEATPAVAQYTFQGERPWPRAYTVVDGPTIGFCVSPAAVDSPVLQRVAEVHEPAAEAVLVAYGHFCSSSGIRVEKPEYEPGDLVVDAGQLGDEH